MNNLGIPIYVVHMHDNHLAMLLISSLKIFNIAI